MKLSDKSKTDFGDWQATKRARPARNEPFMSKACKLRTCYRCHSLKCFCPCHVNGFK